MDENATKLIFSSKTDLWATPQYFFDKLNEEFKFTLDPCSDGRNNKCSKFYTSEEDGLSCNWGGEIVFMNPPYGRAIGEWIKKAYEEGLKENTKVVALIPARTETRYWHDYVLNAQEIRFVKGRIKFGDSPHNAPFPSAVVVFDGKNKPSLGVISAKEDE